LVTGDLVVVLKRARRQVGEDEGDENKTSSVEELDYHVCKNARDLHLHHPVLLGESLFGFERILKHLDGRVLHVTCSVPTRHGDTLRIKGEGMPLLPQRRADHSVGDGELAAALEFGDLFLFVEVELPPTEWYTEERRKAICALLPLPLSVGTAGQDEKRAEPGEARPLASALNSASAASSKPPPTPMLECVATLVEEDIEGGEEEEEDAKPAIQPQPQPRQPQSVQCQQS
jgi:DnaJ-class molecular chaperone